MLAIIIFVFFLVVLFLLIFHAGNKRSVSYRRNVGNLRRDAGLNDTAPPHRSLSSRNYRYPPETGQNDTFEDNWRFGGGRFGGAGAGDSYDNGGRSDFDRHDSNGLFNGSFAGSFSTDFFNGDSTSSDLSGSGPSGSDFSNGDSSSGGWSGSDSSDSSSSGSDSSSSDSSGSDSWNSSPE